MACPRRERTGHCNHFQCPFPSETAHHYNCVDILNANAEFDLYNGICEVGENCLSKCPYSFMPSQKAQGKESK